MWKPLCLALFLCPSLVSASPATPTPARAEPAPTRSSEATPAERPVAAIRHAVVISIDGGRPDVLLRADMPNLRRLMESGSFSMWAQTVPESVTLPSHTSMLTGVRPSRHGINFNKDLPEDQKIYPKVPTLFEVAKRHGLTTAMAAGKSKFDTLGRPGSLDWESIKGTKDDVVGDSAVRLLSEHRPDVLMIHFPGTDGAGHRHGWGSKEQIAAAENIDRQIGRVMAALDVLGRKDSTVVLVSADHGGAGRGHGANDPRSRHIPWIVAGPGIRQNYDLTRNARLTIRTEDTFATVSFLLGLPREEGLDGRPVLDILQGVEMLELLIDLRA